MFLGGLSTNTERQARKSSVKSARKTDDEKPLTIDPSMRRLSASEARGIQYTAEIGKVPRDVLLDFLTTCVRMLLEEYNIVEIIQDSFETKQGLHLAAVEFQRDVLEHNFGIERNFGCKYLAMLAVHHPDDGEVIEAAKNFMFTCMRSYVNALKHRNKMYRKGLLTRPAENEPMNRSAILEFFEGCNALMVMPETKEELRSIFREKKQPPNARIIEMQRNLIKLMGYNVEYGVQCLGRVQQDFATDKEVLMRLQYFMIAADLACRESTFSDTERDEFYKQIPPLMHHFPHIHILQQRMMAHSNHMNQQQQLDPEARAKEIEALKKSGILSLMSTPEGRLKMQDFASRVQQSRETASSEISSWDEDKKSEYFSSFLEHPILALFTDNGGDPANRLNSLFELSPADLEAAMKFILVVGGGSVDLSKKLVELKGTSETTTILESNLLSIQITLGSLANLKPRNTNTHTCEHDHDHSHGHSHDHGHNHSQKKTWDPLKPDVARDGVKQMER